jgi:very-short-patch-repair endonuclease
VRLGESPGDDALGAAALVGAQGAAVGRAVRRQVPLAGRYIVDFCAPSVGLVVEVDGGYHEARTRADARRDAELRRLRYRVLRVEAALVMRDLHAIVRRFARCCEARLCRARFALLPNSSRLARPALRSGRPRRAARPLICLS